MPTSPRIARLTTIDDPVVAAFSRLIPQLSPVTPPDRAALEAIVASGAHLLAAYDPDIVGVLTLTLYRIPTGLSSRIDDVVVDAAARGRGIGAALTEAAIEAARQAGARNVTLTSRPEREAANRLYRRLGFVPVATNVYRFAL